MVWCSYLSSGAEPAVVCTAGTVGAEKHRRNRGAATRRNQQAADSTAAHSAAGAAARECGAPSPEQQILAGCGMAPTPSIRTQAPLKWDTHDAVTDAAASHLRNRGRGPRRIQAANLAQHRDIRCEGTLARSHRRSKGRDTPQAFR